jgi:hypothetical protein
MIPETANCESPETLWLGRENLIFVPNLAIEKAKKVTNGSV